MGRKAHKPTPLNEGRTLLLQQRFLEATNRVCPEVVEGLKKVRGKSSFDKWAEKFGIRQTWVEKAAKSTLAAWEDNPVSSILRLGPLRSSYSAHLYIDIVPHPAGYRFWPPRRE